MIATSPSDEAAPGGTRWTWKHLLVVGLAVVAGVVVPFAPGGLARTGGDVESPAPAPGETRASLEVTSTPRATATLDGRAVGATPLRLTDLAPGTHTLRVEMVAADGSNGNREETLQLRAGEAARRDVRFGRGRLRLTVTPWAELEVDGRRAGAVSDRVIELWEGEHAIKLRNPSLQVEREMTVTIRPDAEEQRTISFTAP